MEMMNYLTSMKIASDANLVSFHVSMFYAQRLLDGIVNNCEEDGGFQKTFSMFKMGYENFFKCTNLSSALIPRINKNDHSLSSSVWLLAQQRFEYL